MEAMSVLYLGGLQPAEKEGPFKQDKGHLSFRNVQTCMEIYISYESSLQLHIQMYIFIYLYIYLFTYTVRVSQRIHTPPNRISLFRFQSHPQVLVLQDSIALKVSFRILDSLGRDNNAFHINSNETIYILYNIYLGFIDIPILNLYIHASWSIF